MARAEVCRAVAQAVAEAVDFGPRDIASAADRAWVTAAISDCVEWSVDDELDLVADLLAVALERAPNHLAERFDRSHEAGDFGID
jgi:hypothetical protein